MPSPHHGFIPSSEEATLRRRVKSELRRRMRGLRNAMPVSAVADRSTRIVGHLAALDALHDARAVALFWPMADRREVDLRDLDRVLRARGARVAYPRIEESGALAFRFVDDPETMTAHDFGHLEPPADSPHAAPSDVDAVVVPALAVDPRGHRIGYGAGHYDRTLPGFAKTSAIIAVAFDFQLVPEVPDTEGDVAAAFVVTDRRVLAATV